MPLPVSHIVYTAQYLGIDPLTQSHFMWLASAALCDTLSPTLPVGWELCKAEAPAKLANYYYNTTLHVAQWEHPSLTHWRSVLAELLAFERLSKVSDGAAPHDAGARSPRNKPQMLWVTAAPDAA